MQSTAQHSTAPFCDQTTRHKRTTAIAGYRAPANCFQDARIHAHTRLHGHPRTRMHKLTLLNGRAIRTCIGDRRTAASAAARLPSAPAGISSSGNRVRRMTSTLSFRFVIMRSTSSTDTWSAEMPLWLSCACVRLVCVLSVCARVCLHLSLIHI